MSSSSSEEGLLEPLNEAVEGLQEKVMEGLPWVIALIAVIAILQALIPWLWSRWWYRNNPVAGKVQRRRQRLSEVFGLKINRVRRDGSIRISPGETGKWQRDGLAEELGAELGSPIRLSVQDGYAWIREVQNIGDTVSGDPAYDPGTGDVIIGVDTETGDLEGFSIKEISGAVLAARPGAGKTALLSLIEQALKPHAEVKVVSGKSSNDLDKAEKEITSAQEEMEKRFDAGIDFWKSPAGRRPVVLILDECARLFEPSSESKEDKASAKHRTRQVKDLLQRGRSAGVITILATQRMSSDVIPTSIRDLATVRICGRVTTPKDAEMVLGRLPEPGEPSPVSAGKRRFIVDDGEGIWQELHVFELAQ
ncbi:AAA family ATPase [Corynebacterium sp. KPL2850]|uniref:AAA family ATPase n=1 Tax=Corynebacterium sp. KPL2850 TaxID=3158318 RepID=UPI0032EFEC0A